MFGKKKKPQIIIHSKQSMPSNSQDEKSPNPVLKIRGKEPLQMPAPQEALKEKKIDKPLPTKTIGKVEAKRTGIFISIGHLDKDGFYIVTATSSFLQGQKAIGRFKMPYSENKNKWKIVLDDLNRSVQNPRKAVTATFPIDDGEVKYTATDQQFVEQKPLIETVGRDLFDALFNTDEIKNIYAESALMADAMFPICIETDNPKIAQLPWEYMHDGDRYVCMVIGPIFRIVPNSLPGLSSLKQSGDLRILVVPSNPPGSQAIDYTEEIANIKSCLRGTGNIVDVPDRQDVDTLLQKSLEFKADIIHFIGHGDEEGILFRDRYGKPITIVELSSMIGALDSRPQVLIFNACYTGTANAEEQKMGFAAHLIKNRVPLVVAMQFSISDDAAKIFSKGFYEYLAAGFPLHRASVWGRVAIKMNLRDTYEWATPVVYVNPGLNLG